MSDNVRVLAAARGTTPTAAARSVGMSAQRLHAKLQDRVRWNVEDLEMLARALDVRPSELLSEGWSLELVRRPRQDSNLQPTDLWVLAA